MKEHQIYAAQLDAGEVPELRVVIGNKLMKKEVILQGLSWGHMPDYLVAAELREGRLVSLATPSLPGGVVGLLAARRAGRVSAPAASALWHLHQTSVGANAATAKSLTASNVRTE